MNDSTLRREFHPATATPSAHHTSHEPGGSDPVALARPLAATAVKTTTYAAAAQDLIPADVSGGSFTITLPSAPADKTTIAVKLIAVAGANTCSIACGGSDVFNKTGGGTTATLSLLNQGLVLQYKTTGGIWFVLADDLPLSQLDARYPLGPSLRLPQYVAASSVVTVMQSGNGWGGSSGVNVNNTGDFVMGTQAASITSAGAGGTWRISKGSLSVDTTGKQIRIRIKCDDTTHIGSGGITFAIANDSGYAASYTWQIWSTGAGSDLVTSGDWVTVTLNFASAVTTGSPTRTAITDMKVTVADDNTAHPVTLRLQSVELIPEPAAFPNGVVSICFDDCWQSMYDYGKAKMDSVAVPMQGGIYVISDMVGTSSRLTQAELLTMQDQGWEIAGHANTDADHALTYTGMTAAQLDGDLRAQKAALIGLGFTSGCDGTAYPLGQYGKTTDAQPTIPITRKYFAYARTTAAGSTRTRETFPPGDPFRLRAVSSITTFAGGYAPTSITATTTGDLDKTKASKGWLIMVFHKIVTGTPAATTEIAQSDFNTIIDKIVSNGMACLPIGTALRYFG